MRQASWDISLVWFFLPPTRYEYFAYSVLYASKLTVLS